MLVYVVPTTVKVMDTALKQTSRMEAGLSMGSKSPHRNDIDQLLSAGLERNVPAIEDWYALGSRLPDKSFPWTLAECGHAEYCFLQGISMWESEMVDIYRSQKFSDLNGELSFDSSTAPLK
jgi:hypothetical protein